MYEMVADLGNRTEELEGKMGRIEHQLDSMHDMIDSMPLRLIEAIMMHTYSPPPHESDDPYSNMNAVLITPTCERIPLGEGSRRFSAAMTSTSQ
jgi:hypothetical protein